MSLAQPDLFGNEPRVNERGLTERQQAAYDLVTRGGATSDEVGANWHAIKSKHAADQRCRFCADEGASVLHSKALAPLVIRKRGGIWQPRNPSDVVRAPSTGLIATSEQDPDLNPWADL